MKGNEARVVLFLHPVKEFKEGQVSKTKPKSMLPRLRSILLVLGTMLALGALGLAALVKELTNKQFTLLEDFSTTTVYPDTPITINNTHATTTETTGSETKLTEPIIATTTSIEEETDTTTTTRNTITTATTTTTTRLMSTLTTVNTTPMPGLTN